MEKKAIIIIESNIAIGDGDTIEVTTPGAFLIEEDKYIAIYEETELSGMEGTTTSLTVMDKKIQLKREGSMSAILNFERGVTDISLYETPYGALEIAVSTRELEINIDENGGEVKIKYEMEVADQPPYITILNMKIKVK